MVEQGTVVDVCIVGGGAAGLAAAIFAAEQPKRPSVSVLDGAKSLGAKILVSGGGRCNVTHETVTADDFFGTRHLVRNVLAAFSVPETRRWFSSLGVELKREESGKLFPVTDHARTVLDALLGRCRALGIVICPDHRVESVVRVTGRGEGDIDDQPRFSIRHRQGELSARQVVLATGGRSLPRSGSDGAGYDLACRLGHRVTTTVPALVALVLDEGCFHHQLSGLSLEAELITCVDGRVTDRRTGSLLWTHFGVSGPVIMDASRVWTLARAEGKNAQIQVNFLPGWTCDQAADWFMREAAHSPRQSLLNTITGVVPERLAAAIVRYACCDASRSTAQLTRPERERLLAALTRFLLPVVRDRGWNFAEVTAGGVPLDEVNFRTMESKLVPGLYLVGEILDCDGRIGGFNFQWAWATGYLAGRAAGSC
jgi:predicted Rossmann fold flavoprotein